MSAPGALALDRDAWVYLTPGGRIKALELSRGTKGHRDLRRRAERVHLGGGLRPRVAVPGDLVRMMEALGRPEQAEQLEAMGRVVELDRGLGPERRTPATKARAASMCQALAIGRATTSASRLACRATARGASAD